MLMNEIEKKVYDRLIKPNIKIIDGMHFIDMNVYQSIKKEHLKSIFVSCLYKNQIHFIDNGKKNISTEINDDIDEYFDDYSIMDDYIEEEIISLSKTNQFEDELEYDLSNTIDEKFINNLYCNNEAKQYIKGYIDGRNFNIQKEETIKQNNDLILNVKDYNSHLCYNQLREDVLQVLDVLNQLERDVLRLKFVELYSDIQISMLLRISEKMVKIIYINAIIKIKNNKYTENLKRYYK